MNQQKKANEGIKIRISGLSNGIYEHHISAEPSVIGLKESFSAPIEIDAKVDKTARQIYLTANVSTIGRVQCDRCLEEFNQPVTGSYAICYVYNEADARSNPDEEFVAISPDTVNIDLTENVRETILISVPLKLLCTEMCLGLCPQCGMNRNREICSCRQEVSDPRWQGLQDLMKQRK
jgi:uncharacterized protein